MKAIIIGGGIAGLTSALALERVGIEAEVFERAPAIREVGAGISLWANALDALSAIGLGDELRRRGFRNERPQLRTSSGGVIQSNSAGANTSAGGTQSSSGPVVGVMHRADLLALLESGIDGARIHLGHECIGCSDDGENVTVRFKNGKEERADVLIGADGIHSVVRSQQFSSAPPLIYAGYIAWRAVVDFGHPGLIPCEIWGRGRRFGAIPLNHQRVYWYATQNIPETDSASTASKSRLKTLFRGWFNHTEALIEAADEQDILRNPIYDREPLERWATGRIALVGDAAHPMTPNLGQGACQAIEDAVVLAAVLKNGGDVREALVQYERRRMPRVNPVVRMSRRIGQVGQWESPVLCAIRNTLLSLMPASASERSITAIVQYQALEEAERALFSTPQASFRQV